MVKKIFLVFICSLPILWLIGVFHSYLVYGEWMCRRHRVLEEIFINTVFPILQGGFDIFYYTIGWLFL